MDYGSGNLHSAQRAFALADSDVVVTSDPSICEKADGLVVPGVGAYEACMNQFLDAKADQIVAARIASERPIFGICVGMQILFAHGSEKQGSDGLGIWPGTVVLLNAPVLPHIGWNTVVSAPDSTLFAGVENESFYFVHSFAAKTPVLGALNSFANYGEDFLAAVETPLVSATQFHPEKSGNAGARLIKNWVSSL